MSSVIFICFVVEGYIPETLNRNFMVNSEISQEALCSLSEDMKRQDQ